jgi:UDP-N-acetyl-D-galactosamine dehydrogenase
MPDHIDTEKAAVNKKFNAVVLGVAHNEFLKLDLEKLRNNNSVLYDVKGVLEGKVDGKL